MRLCLYEILRKGVRIHALFHKSLRAVIAKLPGISVPLAHPRPSNVDGLNNRTRHRQSPSFFCYRTPRFHHSFSGNFSPNGFMLDEQLRFGNSIGGYKLLRLIQATN